MQYVKSDLYKALKKEKKLYKEKAFYMNDRLVKQMQELRNVIDAIEESISADNYPVPTYEQLFTSVN